MNKPGFDIKLQIKLTTALDVNDIKTTNLLPLVSAKYPQKWELSTTPRKLTAYSSPLSDRLRFKSHWAAGVMNMALIVSTMTAIIAPPVARIMKRLYFPKPGKNIL